MKPLTSFKIALSLAALILASGMVGERIGRRAARAELARRDNPETWNEAAMRRFDSIVQPTEDQRVRLQKLLDDAVREMKAIRADTIARSTNVIWRLVAEVEKDLTPEQRKAFESMKPHPGELQTLDLLQVDSSAKH